MDKIKPKFEDPPGYSNRLIGHARPIICLHTKVIKQEEEDHE